MVDTIPAGDPLFLLYVIVFAVAALACFLALGRVRLIDDADTGRGLYWLLLTTASWSATTVLYLVVPGETAKLLIYTVGLIVGLSTILPWLYFCSAYTGRALHRNTTVRRVAIAGLLIIIALKVTNPVHGVYYRAMADSTPFTHLAIEYGIAHWMVMGLSYALAGIGYFMLFELFARVGHDTRPLAVLAGLAGLPIFLDVAALVWPGIIEVNYEPLGVAAFAIGVMYLYLEDFQSAQLAGEHDEPIIVLDEGSDIRDYNAAAREMFPALDGQIGAAVEEVLPPIAEQLDADESVVEVDTVGGLKFYGLTTSPFMGEQADSGTLVAMTDVTEREEYRKELERQNDRLESFAGMVSHDLRNPLTVAKGNLEFAREQHDSEYLETAEEALDRIEALIDDLLALARQGQPIDDVEPVTLGTIARQCWEVVDTAAADLDVESELSIEADPDRLQQLLENLIRNAIEHGSEDVHIRIGPLEDGDGFYVEDDGPGIPAEDREEIFESGVTTNEDGTGFGLAIVSEIVDAHGWSIRATEAEDGGARFEITGVETLS